MAGRTQANSEHFHRGAIVSEICADPKAQVKRFEVISVVVGKLSNGILDPVDCRVVSRSADQTVPLGGRVRKIFKDFGFLEQFRP